MSDAVSFDLDRLRPKARVRLPGVLGTVTLVSVTPGPFYEFVYRDDVGRLGDLTLSESELARVEFIETPTVPPFSGDPSRFRLGIEARRIQIAFEHDMAGLAVSNISPLPHQLEAVYDSFLREPRLRFLLADDPGAGKTIMAGLYIKELMLRRTGDRVAIITPANLRVQWARELAERFQLDFVQFEAATFDASPTQNPWDLFDRVIVSRDFFKTERVRDAFAASQREWDLAIVDEAHGFTLSVDGRGLIKSRSERYKAAEIISHHAHRLLLLTATPHSGKDVSFWGLLRLLDSDAYGDRCPKKLPELNPRHYRKVPKESMVDMSGNKLFKDRHAHTMDYELEGAEWDLYEAVTNFVSQQLVQIKQSTPGSAAGFALTTMQRRLASSIRAIRRTLERRVDRLEKAIDDPEGYLRNRRAFQASLLGQTEADEIEDLDEESRWALEEKALEEWLPDTVEELQAELDALRPLLTLAQDTEASTTERKLAELQELVKRLRLSEDRSKLLLIFTEHKDTLDYLVEVLSKDFEIAQIHGRMKLAERIEQERLFREQAQIMIATEAAGEGINLQFCHLMVNYDIPWNPNRLEQRMGRIHRIGQTEDVDVFNFVAGNTREGAVLVTLLRKLELMGETLGDSVFDVIGDLYAGYQLRDLLERVLAGELTEKEAVDEVGGDDLDPEIAKRAQELLSKALAKHHLDWTVERERAARAEERRLPPSYLERFFKDAMRFSRGELEDRLDKGTLRVTRSPDVLVARSRASGATRRVSPTYARLTFLKDIAVRPRRSEQERELPPAELCGPGHPLFDSLVAFVVDETDGDLASGAALLDPDVPAPALLHFFVGESVDGNGEVVRRTLATVEVSHSGDAAVSKRRSLYDVVVPDDRLIAPQELASMAAVNHELMMWARQHVFEEPYIEAREEREEVARIQADFLRQSFNALLVRADQAIYDAEDEVASGVVGAEGRLRKAELAKLQLTQKRDTRLEEAERGRSVLRGQVQLLGSMVLLQHPGWSGGGATDPIAVEEVEAIAVRVAWGYEESRGVDELRSVEAANIGFDLLSRRGLERRCIEVKGRAGVGQVELTWSEFAKALELGDDYWLYVVLDCLTPHPRLYRVPNPASTLAGAWEPALDVRYHVRPEPVIEAAELT